MKDINSSDDYVELDAVKAVCVFVDFSEYSRDSHNGAKR